MSGSLPPLMSKRRKPCVSRRKNCCSRWMIQKGKDNYLVTNSQSGLGSHEPLLSRGCRLIRTWLVMAIVHIRHWRTEYTSMIILKHLTVERFRLLREMNLHFPQRGSILIQGPYESGKSALLESIYFALYGEALATTRGKRSLDDLISYGATSAAVTLTLSIGATEMTVTRTIERGKEQEVVLYIRRLGMAEEEPVTHLLSANERIIAELGRMDGEALRNSCLLEQKGLDRLEALGGSAREATIRKLLGIEKLMRLTEHFKVEPLDEQQLQESRERLRLAEIQARIPKLSQQLDDVEAALDAVIVCEDLGEIDLQMSDIAEQEQQLSHMQKCGFNRLNRLCKIWRSDDGPDAHNWKHASSV